MKLNCRQAKDAAMAVRQSRLELSPLSYENKILLKKLSDEITTVIAQYQDSVLIEIGSQMHPIMPHDIVELIKDHCKANEFLVKVESNFLNDNRYLYIYGW